MANPVHEKLNRPKYATVSIDSLLGILSSAYGNEDVDQSILDDESITKLRNLSLENLKAVRERTDLEENKQSGRISVATSTTSLKHNTQGGEMDVTLVSIKSLETMKQLVSKSELENAANKTSRIDEEVKHKSEHNMATQESSLVANVLEIEGPTKSFVSSSEQTTEAQNHDVLCGFSISDSNQKVVFDIKFIQKVMKSNIIPNFDVNELEIVLYVTDIFKETQLSLSVPKNKLISKINYFYNVDKGNSLENLDIFVKCNWNVFQWIIQWVESEVIMCNPKLNVDNLKGILSMAYHLEIDNLVGECLSYFHENYMTVLQDNSDITEVFDDALLLKLIDHFTNTEVSEIRSDSNDFKMAMYAILIQRLVDATPNPNHGHYSSLATIFQCALCNKLIPEQLVNSALCKRNEMNFKGEIVPFHEKPLSWDISKYVELMYEDIQNWEVVYWQLWGICHFLNCGECNSPYPLCQSDWCCFHPKKVEYFHMNEHLTYPIGVYKCCGEKQFKFNVIKPLGGCQFKSHRPILCTEGDIAIYTLYKKHKELIGVPTPEVSDVKKFVKLVKTNGTNDGLTNVPPVASGTEDFWWKGIRLAPREKKDYSLIPQHILNSLRNKPERKSEKLYKPLKHTPQIHFTMMPCHKNSLIEQKSSLSNEEMASVKTNRKSKSLTKVEKYADLTKAKIKVKKSSCLYQPMESIWNSSDSIKDNQDNQRDFEEIAMQRLGKALTSECSEGVSNCSAGSYLRLEAQWWQEHCGDSKVTGATKSCGTVVNRTYPLSWYRRVTI